MAKEETDSACAVKLCVEPDEAAYFKFPNPEKYEKSFMAWVAATGDESLLYHHPLEIFYSRRVCRKHFEDKYVTGKVDAMPPPYLHVPTPIHVPRTWIISMIDYSLDVDDQRCQNRRAYIESDVIETSGFVKFSYTTCGVHNWFLYRNMFMITDNYADDEEESGGLWTVPRSILMGEPLGNGTFLGGNIERIRKSVHYILTSPTEYYSLKFKSLLEMHKRTMEECKTLRKQNRNLSRKVREMKRLLYMKHI